MEYFFVNARIHTMTGKTAEAMYVRNGIILDIGSEPEVRSSVSSSAVTVDLKGKCVMPGFIDSHCHLINTGEVRNKMDLSSARSTADLIAIGKAYIAYHNIPEGEPVMGYGFNQNLFDTVKLPEKEAADAISAGHPVILERVCGHVGTVNTYAIEKLGLTCNSHFEGGKLGVRENGELNGHIWENALTNIKGRLKNKSTAYMKSLIRETSVYINSLGITSVHSNDVNEEDFDIFYEACKELEQEDRMTVRIFEEIAVPDLKSIKRLIKKGLKTGEGSDFIKTGNIKIFADGSLGAHSAAMLEEYSDMPGEKGIAVYKEQTELNDMVLTANRAGLQVAIHAIGDLAAAQCVEAFENAGTLVSRELRNRIVHCQIADDALLGRMHTSSIAADIQPPFTVTDWRVAEKAFGERCRHSYRWKTMRDMGIHVGGGSDSPVESFDPIWGIHCAVNRCDEAGYPEGGWHPDEKLSVAEAVSLYTRDAAYLAFEEKQKGTLEKGRLADFIVLTEDIFSVSPMDIGNVRVEKTFIGGKLCYEA